MGLILSVWAHLWAAGLCLLLFLCSLQSPTGTEEDRRSTEINLLSCVCPGHEEAASYKSQSRTCLHNSHRRQDFHPNLSHNTALNNGKTRAAELRKNEQKENPRVCELSAPLRIFCLPGSTRLSFQPGGFKTYT